MTLNWAAATDADFLTPALRPHAVDVLWRGSFIDTSDSVRQAVINSRDDWAEFAKGTLVPQCRSGGWSILGSVNYTLSDRAKAPFDPPHSMDDMTILTAYHTSVEKRLIVDGMKRALLVEKLFQEGKEVPEVRIIERYGPQVHVTFWADFYNILLNAKSRSKPGLLRVFFEFFRRRSPCL